MYKILIAFDDYARRVSAITEEELLRMTRQKAGVFLEELSPHLIGVVSSLEHRIQHTINKVGHFVSVSVGEIPKNLMPQDNSTLRQYQDTLNFWLAYIIKNPASLYPEAANKVL